MSSIITPHPPGSFSILRIPKGLRISKKRKSTKAARPYHTCPAGAASRLIHTPTISSTTTREGSSPQAGSRRSAAQTPAKVKTSIKATVIHNNATPDRRNDRRYHTKAASNAPAVPGATGEKPEPNPVPISIGRKGGLSIVLSSIRFTQERMYSFELPVIFGVHPLSLLLCYTIILYIDPSFSQDSQVLSRPPCRGWSASPCAIAGRGRAQAGVRSRASGSCRRTIATSGCHTCLHAEPGR